MGQANQSSVADRPPRPATHHVPEATQAALFLQGCPKKFSPGLRSLLVATQSLWAHGFARRHTVVRGGSPLSRSAMIEPVHRRHRTSRLSCVKPPAHPIRFVSPAGRIATTDTILKNAMLLALLQKASLDRHSSFDEGFVSIPGHFRPGTGTENGFAPFLWRQSVVFSAQKFTKIKPWLMI